MVAGPGALAITRCVDAQGRTTYSDQVCPPDATGGVVRPGGGGPMARPARPVLTPERRAMLAAELQVALEAQWQKEVQVRTDAKGLIAHNRTTRDVFWFVTPEQPVAWIPLSLNNRIAPGHTLRLGARDVPPGTVFVFNWWYKGEALDAERGVYGPDRVRKVLLQIPANHETSR